jgi:aminoglycoside 3-N-acetyltransferase I
MSIQIKKLGKQDMDQFIALVSLFEDVFEMKNFQMPDKDHLQQLLEKDSFFVFVALADHQVVGGLTSYTLQQYYSIKPLVYIYDLAVRSEYQRQGIGKKLISAINSYCQEMGMEEVFVQADEEDGHALEFYRATGATSGKVVHFNYKLNNE